LRSALVLTAVLVSCAGDEPVPALGRLEQAGGGTFDQAPPGWAPPLTTAYARFGASLALFKLPDGGGAIAVGEPGAVSGSGRVDIVHRLPDGSLGLLQQIPGPAVIGSAPGFGTALALADFNADGTLDLAVGAPGYCDGGFMNEGAVLIYSGSTGSRPFDSTPRLVVNPLTGTTAGSYFGWSVAVSAHWNSDSRPDLIIGGKGMQDTYVYAGVSGGAFVSSTPSLDMSATGEAVAGIDVNNDGFTDTFAGDTQSGVMYPQEGSVTMTTTNTVDTFIVPNVQQLGSLFGASLAGLGDINGDQQGDVAIGMPGFSPIGVGPAGGVSIYFGNSGGIGYSQDLSWPTASGAQFGVALANVGAFERPGLTELLVGAPVYTSATQPGVGAAFLYDVSAIKQSGTAPLQLVFSAPAGAASDFGRALAGGVDLDGDGLGDIVVGAPGYSPDMVNPPTGAIFVYLAPRDGGTSTANDAGSVTGDAGWPDAGTVFDAGGPDAGVPDAGGSDGGGEKDGGAHDGGKVDAGAPDAGSSDASLPDAGAPADGGEGQDGGLGRLSDPSFTTCGCHADAGTLLLVLAPLVMRRRRFRQ
jgi:hypothetical protein